MNTLRKHLPIVLKSAFEALEEEKSRLKMVIGDNDLDSLIGGVAEGFFYLFYGEQEVLERIIYKVLIGCVLPKEKGGFQAKGIYFNNTDYYTGKTILNPSELGGLAKQVGIDPNMVFSNIYAAAAYNEQRQLIVAKQVAELMRSDPSIRLLAVHNLTRFFADSKKPEETRRSLKQVINYIWNTSSRKRVAVVATADATAASKSAIPAPMGGTFLLHVASVIVYFKRLEDGAVPSVKATLVKHPYKKTPESIILTVSKGGVDLMGRITPSFRQRYEELISELKSCFQRSLIDPELRQAFDLLLKEAWGAEQAAMGNSNLPTVLDALNITANLHNRRMIEALRRRLEEREKAFEELKRRVEELGAKIR
ncbi:MAG: hypothetical protein QXJ86_05840 [Nitrososphaerales archaeon]